MENENELMQKHYPGDNRPRPQPQPQPQPQDSCWFWKDGLSIDETKMSTLIICLIICMAFGGVNYIVHGDITNNLTSIIQALIYAIAGVNIGNGLLSKFGGNNSNLYSNQNMMSSNNTMTSIREVDTQAIPPGVTSMPQTGTQGFKTSERK